MPTHLRGWPCAGEPVREQGEVERSWRSALLGESSVSAWEAISVELILQLLNLIENPNETLAEPCKRVLDTWRDFGMACLLKDAEPDQLHQPFVQYLGCQSVCCSLQLTGTADALPNLSQDVQRPLAANALLENLGDGWFRVLR